MSGPASKPRPRGGIQSLQRAFDILEIVGRSGVAGATQIAAELNLAVSTVNNLCRTMAGRGYLIGVRGQYRLGPAISLAAAQWDPAFALPELLQPVLRDVSERTGQSSAATVLVGDEARVIAFEQGPGPIGTPRPTLDRQPLDVPTGTVLVALSRQGQWDDFISRTDADSVVQLSREEWAAELAHVAESRVCARRSADPRGQTAIGVPVLAGGDAVVCAIGSSAPTFLVDDELTQVMLDALVDGARTLSQRLGCTDYPPVATSLESIWRATV